MARNSAALRLAPETLSIRREPHYADTGEVEEFAAGLKETFLYCRELGHNWKPYTAASGEGGGFVRTLRCVRCRTRRVQELNSRGAIISNHYEYAEGYQAKGLGRIVGEGRDMLRLESLTRLTKGS